MKKVFVVTAYRYGDKESHSYVLGVFEQRHLAIESAEQERDYRGGKYYCEVLEVELDICKGLRKVILPIEEY